MTSIVKPGTRETESLALDLVTTLGDQMAFLDHALARPELRRARLIREGLIIAGAPLGLVLGGVVAWVLDSDRIPMRAVLHDLFTGDLALVVKAVAIAYVVVAACILMSRRTQRAQRRRVLKKILLARPDVDKADPDLSQRTVATFGPEGIDSRTAAGTSLVRWTAIERLDETDDYLFFISGPFGGFIVPKRALRPGEAERLRAITKACLPRPVEPSRR